MAARLTGWRVDIKGETQLAEEEAGGSAPEYADGEWVVDPTTGEQLWVPADGSDAVSAEDWSAGAGANEAESLGSAIAEAAQTETPS